MKNDMIKGQVQLTKNNVPSDWSFEAADFINKCLQIKPANRLGANGPIEIKQHLWLKNLDWEVLIDKHLKSPLNIDVIFMEIKYRLRTKTLRAY